MITLYARTVGELKEALSDVPEDREWFGWDDGVLFIYGDDGQTEEIIIINEGEEK